MAERDGWTHVAVIGRVPPKPKKRTQVPVPESARAAAEKEWVRYPDKILPNTGLASAGIAYQGNSPDDSPSDVPAESPPESSSFFFFFITLDTGTGVAVDMDELLFLGGMGFDARRTPTIAPRGPVRRHGTTTPLHTRSAWEAGGLNGKSNASCLKDAEVAAGGEVTGVPYSRRDHMY
ncbi:hypothetical protein T484DRAFT_1901585, partial [Baffinella frigidus]